ncbi:phosphatase 2C-like domain-containing protein [Xylariaceae sp. FL0016]|nr:phosphatase 2C-like domain-containing protein [Xylariaceae sp. FL0016]
MTFPRHLLRQRPRLVTTTRLIQSAQRPRFSSTKPQISYSRAGLTALVGTVAGYSAHSISQNGGSDSNTKEVAAATLAPVLGSHQVPDLDQSGPSDQVAFAPAPTMDDVEKHLNEHAFSLEPALGVRRYDGAQLGSNNPCEDALLHGQFTSAVGADRWLAWAVFDGHCGWQLSHLLTTQLMPYVRRALADAGSDREGKAQDVPEEAVHSALKAAFTSLDDALVKTARDTIESDLPFAEKVKRLEPAYAGACALLTLYDPAARKLRVASTGDCRAVLGQRTADGRWRATALSQDCTGATPSEAARVQAQFPDEPDVVRGGRIWGMQPSRTFGDGMWKWPAQLKEQLRLRFNGNGLPHHLRYKNYREGPYLTAEPLVTTTDIPASQPSFVILATDGLWDTMSSEQAVDLVGKWMDWRTSGRNPKPVKPEPSDFGPTVLGWAQQCKYEEKKATVQDENAAVHLIRNGLGGGDDEMVRGALTFRYNSRDIRDDITVQVVFFDPKQGKDT